MKRIMLPLFGIGLLCMNDRVNSANLIIPSVVPSVSLEGSRQTNNGVFAHSSSLYDFTHAFGSITGDYNCGPDPLTIVLEDTAKIYNDTGPKLTIQNLTFVDANSKDDAVFDGGGAIYNDGLTMTLSLCGTRIEHNEVNAYGAAIFFVSNNHDGTIQIEDTIIRNNFGGAWELLPGISAHSDTTLIIDEDSIIE